MKHFGPVITALALASYGHLASAQFVKGNEAVIVRSDETRTVETPPLPAKALPRPCAAQGGCHPGPWHMVETSEGLRECTEPFARATTCRPSTFGSQKLARVWVIKKGNTWLWCQYPDMGRHCVDMHARPPLNLPVSAVQ